MAVISYLDEELRKLLETFDDIEEHSKMMSVEPLLFFWHLELNTTWYKIILKLRPDNGFIL